jgi:hypothetical protein
MSGVNLVVGIALVATALVGVGLLLFFLLRWKHRPAAEEGGKPYVLDKKFIAIGVLTEIIVAAAGMIGVGVFAFQHEGSTRALMLTGGAIFAIFAVARIPFAIKSQTHPLRSKRALAVGGVLASAAMDVIALVLLLVVTVEPRLLEVHKTGAALEVAREAVAGNAAQFERAQDSVAKATILYESAQARLRAASSDLGRLPHCRNCGTGASASLMRDNLREANAAVAAAKRDIDAANLRLSRLDPNAGSEAARAADKANRDAVSSSQVHMVAGALLGIDASRVSDEQVGWMKKIMIVAPALLASLIGAFLSMLAVTPLPPRPSTEVRNTNDVIKLQSEKLVSQQDKIFELKAALERAAKPARIEPLDEKPQPPQAPLPEPAPQPQPAAVAAPPLQRETKPARRLRRAAAAKSKSKPINGASPWAGLPVTRAPPLSPAATPAPHPNGVTQLDQWRTKPLTNGSLPHED